MRRSITRWGRTAPERLAGRNMSGREAATTIWECCSTASGFLSIQKSFLDVVEQGPKLARAGGMTQFPQSFGFNLANAFPSHVERLPDLFQGVFRTIVHPKAHADDFFFSRAEGAQHVRGAFLQIHVQDCFCR